MSELATLFLRTRLEKVLNNPHIDKINLLDEEKFILDSNTDMDTRKNMIMTGYIVIKRKSITSTSMWDMQHQLDRFSSIMTFEAIF